MVSARVVLARVALFASLLSFVVSGIASLPGCAADDRKALGTSETIDAGADAALDGTPSSSKDGQSAIDATSDATSSFKVRGVVLGLRGNGLVLSLGSEDLALSTMDGGAIEFTFKALVATGASYAVSIKAQPTSPEQICGITSGAGVMGTRDVTDVEVFCETIPYAVGGNVLGLVGGGLVLRNSGSDDLPITAMFDGGAPDAGEAGVPVPVPFTFAKKVESGAPFDVTIAQQPLAPSQTCSVSGGQGNVVAGDVSTVTVNCVTNAFTVGGSVSNMLGSGLKLKNSLGEEISVNATSFAFPSLVKSGDAYAVTVSANPTNPWQTCEIAPGTASGVVGAGSVTNIAVSCTTNTYTVGGSVSGVLGTGMKLTNNQGDEISITQDGPFSFPTKIASGADYKVAVSADPQSPSQQCTVTNGEGKIAGSDWKNVSITCTVRPFTVGGVTNGPLGTGPLRLKNNGTDEITITQQGAFEFNTPVPSGQPYSVLFSARPAFTTCALGNASGFVGNTKVTTVALTCTEGTTVGGSSTAVTQMLPNDTLLARAITLPASTVHAIGGYWADAGCSVKYALYTDVAAAPGALVAQTPVITTVSSGASELAVTNPVAVPAGNYWVALVSLTACNGHLGATGGTGYYARVSSFASPFPDPFGVGAPGGGTIDVSSYVRIAQ